MLRSLFKKGPERSITVVIRSVGERTEGVCLDLIRQQVTHANIHVIHETPFSKALQKSYEIGIKAGRKWTMVLDADVLVREGFVAEIFERAEKAPESVFVFHSSMLDKFFGGIRVGGAKLYRTKLLPKAMELVPEVDVRPETYVVKKMHKQGAYVDITDILCGVHDFEQYYSDIFRKGFAHGVKHQSLADSLKPYWTRMKKKDKDFEVLLAGSEIGAKHRSELKLAKDEVLPQFQEYASPKKLKEKANLKDLSDELSSVQAFLDNFVSPPEYEKIKAENDKKGRPVIPDNAK